MKVKKQAPVKEHQKQKQAIGRVSQVSDAFLLEDPEGLTDWFGKREYNLQEFIRDASLIDKKNYIEQCLEENKLLINQIERLKKDLKIHFQKNRAGQRALKTYHGE